MRMRTNRALAVATVASLLVLPARAGAQADLNGGLKAKFKNTASGKQKAVVKFKGLPPGQTPGCPEQS